MSSCHCLASFSTVEKYLDLGFRLSALVSRLSAFGFRFSSFASWLSALVFSNFLEIWLSLSENKWFLLFQDDFYEKSNVQVSSCHSLTSFVQWGNIWISAFGFRFSSLGSRLSVFGSLLSSFASWLSVLVFSNFLEIGLPCQRTEFFLVVPR